MEFIWFTTKELKTSRCPIPRRRWSAWWEWSSVSEAAALKAGGVELILPKQKGANATLAVARVAWRS